MNILWKSPSWIRYEPIGAEDQLYDDSQCPPWWHDALCNIIKISHIIATVPVRLVPSSADVESSRHLGRSRCIICTDDGFVMPNAIQQSDVDGHFYVSQATYAPSEHSRVGKWWNSCWFVKRRVWRGDVSIVDLFLLKRRICLTYVHLSTDEVWPDLPHHFFWHLFVTQKCQADRND